MSEATFALQILNTLAPLPRTLSPTHTLPPAQQPTHTPVLPRLPKPYINASPNSSQTSARGTTTVVLRPLKGEAVTLAGVAWDASVYQIKVGAGRRTGYAPDKIKVLWEKRPVSDSKTVREVVGTGAEELEKVELGVMFVGKPTEPVLADGEDVPASVPVTEGGKGEQVKEEPAVAQGESGEDVLKTEAFWTDLRGFVLQRVRDEGVAKKLVDVFQSSWAASAR